MEALKLVIVTDDDGNLDVIPWDEPGELVIIESPRPSIGREPWGGADEPTRTDAPKPTRRVH